MRTMVMTVMVIVVMAVFMIMVVVVIMIVFMIMMVIASDEPDTEDPGHDSGEETDDGPDNGHDGPEEGIGDQDRIRSRFGGGNEKGHAGRTGGTLSAQSRPTTGTTEQLHSGMGTPTAALAETDFRLSSRSHRRTAWREMKTWIRPERNSPSKSMGDNNRNDIHRKSKKLVNIPNSGNHLK